MPGSKYDMKMYVRSLGYPIPLQTDGPKNTYFRRLRLLTATLTAYIFGTKHDIHNRASALETTRSLSVADWGGGMSASCTSGPIVC